MQRELAGAMVLAAATCAGPTPEPTFRWDFGDGATAGGRTVDHVYVEEGTFTVTVSVESGGRALDARARVEARSLSGQWHSRDMSGPISAGFGFNLTQNESSLAGRVGLFSSCPLPAPGGTLEGELEHPLTVRWTLTCSGTSRWSGSVSASLDTITVRREGATEPRVYYRLDSPDDPGDHLPQ